MAALTRNGHYQYVMPDGTTTRPCVCVHFPTGKNANDGIGNFQVFLNSATSEQGLGSGGAYYATNVPFKPFNEVTQRGTPGTWFSE